MNDDIGTLIEPPPVEFTFGAPGWYVLGSLLLFSLFAITVLFVRHYRRNQYRRDALSWLAGREQHLQKTPDVLLYDATTLLKRIVMLRYGREFASIRGRDWIALLNSSCRSTLFADEDADWITHALYAPGGTIAGEEVQRYLNKTRTWIKRHRYAL